MSSDGRPGSGPSGGGTHRVYNAALLVGLPVLAGAVLCRRRTRVGLRERLGMGCYPRARGRPGIWLHAVSVGEVAAAAPVVAQMRRLAPEAGIVLSTVTATGRQRAGALLADVPAFYAPLDLSWAVSRVVRAVRPDLYLSVDTDLWPNLTRALSAAGVPIVLVNGRISDGSFRRWQRARSLAAEMFSRVDLFCMQTERDAERALALGARPGTVTVTGSTKYDALGVADPEALASLRGKLGLAPGQVLLVGGSTHPGEEEALLDAAREGLASGAVRVALVPRHPERGAAVARLAAARGWRVMLYSALEAGGAAGEWSPWQVLVVDRIGVLGTLYGLASVAFVGKSLCAAGGQNPLEPAAAGVPVLFGPRMDNFREQADALVRDGAARVVRSVEELSAEMVRLLASPGEREAMGRAGEAHVAARRGAAVRCAQAALEVLRGG